MKPTLASTLELVKEYHGQANAVDKGGKTPYYWHLLRVMLRIENADEELCMIALLHDIVEDTPITLKALRDLGYSERVVQGVRWCSRNMFPELNFAQWMQKIGQEAPEDSVIVKIADISDNLGFERMRGLMGKRSDTPKPQKEMNLRQKIDKKVSGKMKLHGEMGVYDRYYKGWNFMFENPARLPLIEQVFLEDFCHFEQLKKLAQWISPTELSDYLSLNKIHAWKVPGVFSVLKSKAQEDYLGFTIDENVTGDYVKFLAQELAPEFIHNQQNRDRQHHHLTLINAAQYGKLKKEQPEQLEEFMTKYLGQSFDFWTYGIGTAQAKNKQAWFIVAENAELVQLREPFLLAPQDFHITLAFDKGDVFGLPKDRTSIIHDNTALWNYFINHTLFAEPVKKERLKF